MDSQTLFLLVMLVFAFIGFQRGWKREVVSLVFVVLAAILIRPNTSDSVGGFFNRLPSMFAYLSGQPQPEQHQATVGNFFTGPTWSFFIFVGLCLLGYYIGNRVFPKPATPQERFIGIIPAIIAGAFVLAYLTQYVQTVSVSTPNPSNYVAIIFIVAIVALVVALIAGRVKKAKR